MPKYTPPDATVTKHNMTGRVTEIERARSQFSNAHNALADAVANLPKPEPPAPPQKGERGSKGDAGRDGRDGKDGVGLPGRNGTNGRDGKDGAPGAAGPDSAAVLAETRAELETVRREFADLKLVVNAIYEQNKQGAGYIEYLRAKTAARIAERNKQQ